MNTSQTSAQYAQYQLSQKQLIHEVYSLEQCLDNNLIRLNQIDEQINLLAREREHCLEEKTNLINEMKQMLRGLQGQDKILDEDEEDEYDEDDFQMEREDQMNEVQNNYDQQYNEYSVQDFGFQNDRNKRSDLNSTHKSIGMNQSFSFNSNNKSFKSSKTKDEEYERFKKTTKDYLRTFDGASKSYPKKLKLDLLYFASKHGMKLVARDVGVAYANLKTWKRKQLLNIL